MARLPGLGSRALPPYSAGRDTATHPAGRDPARREGHGVRVVARAIADRHHLGLGTRREAPRRLERAVAVAEHDHDTAPTHHRARDQVARTVAIHVGEWQRQRTATGEDGGDLGEGPGPIAPVQRDRREASVGESARAIASGRRAAEIAADPISRAYALGYLGRAYLESGEVPVCRATGDSDGAATYAKAALETFRRLRVPPYVERAETLLRQLTG